MYAIVKIAGRQYRISPDEVFKVDRLKAEPGDDMTFTTVMMIDDGKKIEVGEPHVGYKVTLEVVEHGRNPKVITGMFKRRGGMRRKRGHRQQYSLVKVKSIKKSG